MRKIILILVAISLLGTKSSFAEFTFAEPQCDHAAKETSKLGDAIFKHFMSLRKTLSANRFDYETDSNKYVSLSMSGTKVKATFKPEASKLYGLYIFGLYKGHVSIKGCNIIKTLPFSAVANGFARYIKPKDIKKNRSILLRSSIGQFPPYTMKSYFESLDLGIKDYVVVPLKTKDDIWKIGGKIHPYITLIWKNIKLEN